MTQSLPSSLSPDALRAALAARQGQIGAPAPSSGPAMPQTSASVPASAALQGASMSAAPAGAGASPNMQASVGTGAAGIAKAGQGLMAAGSANLPPIPPPPHVAYQQGYNAEIQKSPLYQQLLQGGKVAP